ncbi:Caffeyl-CoA reductase-Etf complex subunit CarC [subsurface metagenome]
MDFRLSQEQLMLKRLVHDLGEKELKEKEKEWEEKGQHIPSEYHRKLANLGLMGIAFPKKYGGQGLGVLEAVIATEEAGRVSTRVGREIFECNLGAAKLIEQLGTEAQKQKYLPHVSNGDYMIATAMTEPEAGSALTDLQTRAVLKGDCYVVNGQKTFITGAPECEAYVVYARFGEQRGARGIGAIIIDKNTLGLSFGKQQVFMGMYAPRCDIFFDDCHVPKENLIVGEMGFKKLITAFDTQRCGNAANSLGIAQGALECAMEYSQQRKQFGKPICEFQAIQFMLAEMALRVEAARLLLYRAAANAGTGLARPYEAMLAKCFANEAVREVTARAVEILGGYGYSKEYPVERMFRDAWGYGIGGGTIEMQKIGIASQLLDRKFSQR